ncbi:MAG: alpha/beta hydrolase [Paracoccus denitrificans]|nr:MAG: alpha/beta hydrolase [Paracoccus denitrificans]PZO84636.1 MAG: alpha/beta hydrolase [Paracoccus denitrificans]
MTEFFTTPQGRRIAYRRTEGQGGGPGIVFIHGFRSDMNGSKIVDLESRAQKSGRAMLCFDLSGHGESAAANGDKVEDFGVSDWLEDAAAIIDQLATGPQVLVGSSLGGWLALLLARNDSADFAGLVTIAAAPDFTTRMQGELTADDQDQLAGQGYITRPTEYEGGDYVFSRRLFQQGAVQQIFTTPLTLTMPTRMLIGTADDAVPVSDALQLIDHAKGPDIQLTLVKDADHRFSTPDLLDLIWLSVVEVG